MFQKFGGISTASYKATRILKYVVTGKKWQDINSLLSIKGQCDKPHQIGWYLGVVTSPNEDKYLKKYVGQSDHMGHRMRNHRADLKAGENARQLFHKVAGTYGRQTDFVLLGTWSKDDILPLDEALLDLVEMYFAILFQSLQRPSLERWLPPSVEIVGDDGLNVQLPLRQHSRPETSVDSKRLFREVAELRYSTDPEIKKVGGNITKDAAAKGRATTKAQGYVPLSQGQRKAKGTKRNIRGPETEEERNIRIECSHCGAIKGIDADPLYTLSAPTRYVCREQICESCPEHSVNPKTGAKKFTNPSHRPVDKKILTVSLQKVDKIKEAVETLQELDRQEAETASLREMYRHNSDELI